MQCKNKRTIFNLFTYYNCNDCVYRNIDDHFNYSNSCFHIYFLFSECPVSEKCEELFFKDSKIKRFLYDAIFYEKENIFILIEKKDLNDVFNYLEIIDNFNKNIQIVII